MSPLECFCTLRHFFSIQGLAGLPQQACCGVGCFFLVCVVILFFLGVAVSWNKCICILKSCFCQTLNVKQRSVKLDCEASCSLPEHLWSFSPPRLRHFAVLASPCQHRFISVLRSTENQKENKSLLIQDFGLDNIKIPVHYYSK